MASNFRVIEEKWSSLVVDTEWTPRTCPACLARESTLRFEKKNVPFLECANCRTVYINPVPPADLLVSLYDDLGGYFTAEEKLEVDFDPNRYRREISAIPAGARRGRLLDVGCATGSFLVAALSAGFAEVRGIDVSSPSIAYANKHIGPAAALAGDFLKQPFEPGEFDVVTLWVTLEHLAEPDCFVRESWRVLKDKGLFCFSVPNGSGLSLRILNDGWSQVELDHLNYFTPLGLKKLCERNGFKVLTIQARSFNPFRFWKDWRGQQQDALTEERLDYLLCEQRRNIGLRRRASVRAIEYVLDSVWNAFGIGDLLIVIAQKV